MSFPRLFLREGDENLRVQLSLLENEINYPVMVFFLIGFFLQVFKVLCFRIENSWNQRVSES